MINRVNFVPIELTVLPVLKSIYDACYNKIEEVLTTVLDRQRHKRPLRKEYL